jgi:hypothetical protein
VMCYIMLGLDYVHACKMLAEILRFSLYFV